MQISPAIPWQNTETLISHSLKVVDNNFLAHHALGELSAGKGEMKEAIFHFSKAVEIKPDNAALWAKLGRALYSVDLKPKAIYSFKKAQALDPKHPGPHFYLLCSFLDKNKIIKAQEQLVFMFEKNSSLIKDKDYLLFKRYVGNKDLETSEKNFKIILTKLGIINSKYTFRALIIKGHKDWETAYIEQVSHEN